MNYYLEQANGQTTIYDNKLNVLFRVEGSHFDALMPIVDAANNYNKLISAKKLTKQAGRIIAVGAEGRAE